MPITLPSLEEVHERLVDAARAAFPLYDLSRFNDFSKRLRIVAGAAFQLNHHIAVVSDDVLPDTAAGDQLDRHGFIWGVTRKPATPARKADALRLVGTSGSTFTIGDELVSVGGLRFQVNESGSIPAAGFLDVDVVAIDTGEQTRLQAGEVLSFISPPAGIETEAELQLDLDEDGTDQESDGAYRVRIMNKIQQPAMGGNANDWAQWVLDFPGADFAYVYPERAGAGTVQYVALHVGSGTVRVFTTLENSELRASVDAERPVSVADHDPLVVEAIPNNTETLITPALDPQFAFDWDDSAGPLIVSAWDAATRTLTFTTNRPTDMQEGDRIVFKPVSGLGDGAPHVIERFPGAANQVILETAPSLAPVNPDEVYAGGPLTEPVRNALLEHMDNLGPAIGDHGVGNWEDSINPQRLDAIALTETGVSNSQTTTPASTAVPSDPGSGGDITIELLYPRRTLVRKAP